MLFQNAMLYLYGFFIYIYKLKVPLYRLIYKCFQKTDLDGILKNVDKAKM